MAYTLPLVNQLWPDFRILVAESFAATSQADSAYVAGGDNSTLPLAATSKCGWRPLPYKQRGTNKPGFWVQTFERACLPIVGKATIAFDYGIFDDATIADPEVAEAFGTTWEVRIQARERSATPGPWITVWWGTCDYLEDQGDPGASTPRGRRLYQCVDGLYRSKRWVVDRHGSYTYGGAFGASQRDNLFGNPGYNYEVGRDAPLMGNRYPTSTQYLTPAGVSVWYHQAAGATKPTASNVADSLWTDRQAVEHALGANKPIGEPTFSLQGATDLLAAKNPWRISEGEDVHDFLVRVLKRERGRGVAFVDWTESDPDGDLTVFITVNAQLAADVNYTDPTDGSGKTLRGATSRSTTTTVDLVGDHRNLAGGGLALGDPSQFRIDFLETMGEPIEVLATLSVLDGKATSQSNSNGWDGVALMRGWTDAQQTSFVGLPANSAQAKEDDKYNPVFQLFRFNQAWDGRVGDGNAGGSVKLHRIDYRCDRNGNIVTPYDAIANKDTDPAVLAPISPLLVEVMGDLPLIEGYTYAGDKPDRWDATDELNRQPRRRITGYVRTTGNRYVQFDDPLTPLSASIHVDAQGIWVRHSGDESNGTRFFAAPTSSGFSSSGLYDYSAVVITAGLRLPTRVRFASGDPINGRRRGRIYHPGSHLWLSSPGAIWALNTATETSGAYAARRNACGGAVVDLPTGGTSSRPGILRDDRSGLAAIHALAWAWYGTDTTHRTARWGLRACGFLPSYQAYPGTSVPTDGSAPTDVFYPTIGQVVTTLAANGMSYDLNTPVTRVSYNNETGMTHWSTEWAELEHVQR